MRSIDLNESRDGSDVLLAGTRNQVIGVKGFMARLGGEEFIGFLPTMSLIEASFSVCPA